VATTPINTEDHDLLARKFMIDFNLLEVSLWRLVLSLSMPKINSANPPKTCIIILKYTKLVI
jgi:hypothetical protein